MSKQPAARTTLSADVPTWGFSAPVDMESMMYQYSAWLEDWNRVQQESLEFVRVRLERDAQAAAQVAACTTPAEFVEWQMSFARDTVEDYLRQGQKMTEMLMQSANARQVAGGDRA